MNTWDKLKLVSRGLAQDYVSSKRGFAYSSPQQVFEDSFGSSSETLIAAEETLAVFTSAKILSSTIGMIPFELRKDSYLYKDNPLFGKLLYKMSNMYNNQSILSALEYERSLFGNAFVDIRNDSNWTIIPHEVVDEWRWKNGRLDYRFNWGKHPDINEFSKYRTKANIEWVSSDKVLHFKSTTKNGVMGIPQINVARHNIAILNKAMATIDSFYSNRAMSPMQLQSELKDSRAGKQFLADIKDFLDNHKGVRNAGKALVLPPNTKLTQLQTQFQDAQLVETMKFARDEIFNMFGIPSFMYNSSGDVQMDIEQQSLNFKSFTIEPIVRVYEEELMYKLLSVEDRVNGVDVRGRTSVLIEADISAKSNAYGKLIQNAVMTPDQASVEMGIPVENDTEWGNKKYMQKQMYPIEFYRYLIEQEAVKVDGDVKEDNKTNNDSDEGDKTS